MTRLDSRAAGPYATRDFALRVAIAEALRLRATGRGIRIAVQDTDGTICAEQCLCKRFTPLNVLSRLLRRVLPGLRRAVDRLGEIFRRLRAGHRELAAENEAGHALDAGFLGG